MSQYVTKVRTAQGDKQIDYNALANLPYLNNQNMLINGDFRINQRSKTAYTQASSWTYSVDRWKYIGIMTVAVNESGTITISKSNNNDYTYFAQQLEDIHGAGSYTLSFNVKSISGAMQAYIEGSGSNNILDVTAPGTYHITSSEGAKGVYFRLAGNTASVELSWAKLEPGSVATPFVPRLKAEELAMCRRYYRKYSNGYCIGLAIVTSDSIVLPESDCPMRVESPTLRILSTTTFNPLVQNKDKYVDLTTGYAVATEYSQIVSFHIGTATTGEMGRVYGTFELDAEIY